MPHVWKRIKDALYHFVWGQEVELGDCIFYTVLTLVLLGLLWLFTFERLGISVNYSLFPWVALVFLIWRQYYRTHPEKFGKRTTKE